MAWFANLKIMYKLMIAALAAGLLTAALGVLAISRLSAVHRVVTDISDGLVPGMRLMLDIKAALAEYRIAEVQLVNRTSDTVVPDYLKRLKGFREHIEKDEADADALAAVPRQRELYGAARRSLDDYLATSDRIIADSTGKQGDRALQALNGPSKDLRRACSEKIDAAIGYNVQAVAQARAEVTRVYLGARVILIAGTLLTVMLGLLCGGLIARGVVRSIRAAATAADNIARGIIDSRIESGAGDEAGSLLRSMRTMQQQLQNFVAGLGEMARRDGLGELSYRIPLDQLPGAYGDMAGQVNALVASHIDVQRDMIEVVQQYAQGGLDARMQRLPGEKARFSDSIDAVRASIMAVNAEILKLVEAAARGDFSARGDVARYSNDFARMVAGLNQLMESSDSGLKDLAAVLAAIADGDLGTRMSGEYPGAFGKLRDDANRTVQQLRRIVAELQRTTETIDRAAGEISSGNADLSSRTEAQAASLEETASTMEQLTVTVRQNAERSRRGNELAISASSIATRGGEAVSGVVRTMSAINLSSNKIADIIGVIDGIAFQTNILALNAAVEAARAGEQGRGFAVVASEVRNLAQRSAAAAREIKSLITDSVQNIKSGTALVGSAGATMQEIENAIRRVCDIMAQISTASAEQAAGIEQVNSAITQMDNSTQQNAALVEQAAAATKSMAEQTQNMTRAMAVFRLGDEGDADAWAAAEVAAA